MTLSEERNDMYGTFAVQLYSFVRQFIKDERLIGKIVHETLLAFETKTENVHINNKPSISVYLRLTAKRLIKAHECNSSNIAGVSSGRNPNY